MRNTKQLVAGLAVAMAMTFGSLANADVVYFGDAASEGQNVLDGNSAYSLTTLTIVNLSDGFSGSPVIYTSPIDQTVTLTEVNFFTQNAGNVTPFVTKISGAAADGSFNGQLASSYELLAVGDSVAGGPGVLVNGAFEVGGVNPTINLLAGDRIAAGFLTDTDRLVRMDNPGAQGVSDYIFDGDSLSSAAIGSNLTGNSDFAQFDRSLSFNIALETVSVPEPASATLLTGLVLPLLLRRRRA